MKTLFPKKEKKTVDFVKKEKSQKYSISNRKFPNQMAKVQTHQSNGH